jgi:hypothetical protein
MSFPLKHQKYTLKLMHTFVSYALGMTFLTRLFVKFRDLIENYYLLEILSTEVIFRVHRLPDNS